MQRRRGSDLGLVTADLAKDGTTNAEDQFVEAADCDCVLHPRIPSPSGVCAAMGEDAADHLDAVRILGEVESGRKVTQQMRIDLKPGLVADRLLE